MKIVYTKIKINKTYWFLKNYQKSTIEFYENLYSYLTKSDIFIWRNFYFKSKRKKMKVNSEQTRHDELCTDSEWWKERERKRLKISSVLWCYRLGFLFDDISTLVGYLMPKLYLGKDIRDIQPIAGVIAEYSYLILHLVYWVGACQHQICFFCLFFCFLFFWCFLKKVFFSKIFSIYSWIQV